MAIEYNFYLEQKYLNEERVEARILTAAQAEALGYEDDYRRSTADMWMDLTVWKLFIAI